MIFDWQTQLDQSLSLFAMIGCSVFRRYVWTAFHSPEVSGIYTWLFMACYGQSQAICSYSILQSYSTMRYSSRYYIHDRWASCCCNQVQLILHWSVDLPHRFNSWTSQTDVSCLFSSSPLIRQFSKYQSILYPIWFQERKINCNNISIRTSTKFYSINPSVRPSGTHTRERKPVKIDGAYIKTNAN